jgi:hypothetical protein
MGGLRAPTGATSRAEIHFALAAGEPHLDAKKALKSLLAANKRLNTA